MKFKDESDYGGDVTDYPRDDDCIDCGMPLIGGRILRVHGGALCSSCMDRCDEDPADENDASNYGGDDDD